MRKALSTVLILIAALVAGPAAPALASALTESVATVQVALPQDIPLCC